jgi:hypothetical protein
MLKSLKGSMSISSWITTPPTRHPRSKRGSPAGRITMSTSRQLPRHGSIRSSAGSLNSPERRSSEVSTPPSGSSRPTSAPSSTCTTETRSPCQPDRPDQFSTRGRNGTARKICLSLIAFWCVSGRLSFRDCNIPIFIRRRAQTSESMLYT